jgi:hypothetical protein
VETIKISDQLGKGKKFEDIKEKKMQFLSNDRPANTSLTV